MKKLTLFILICLTMTACNEVVVAPTPSPKTPAVWGDETNPETAAKWDNVKWQ